jgi:hypothetical protein
VNDNQTYSSKADLSQVIVHSIDDFYERDFGYWYNFTNLYSSQNQMMG